LPRGKACQLRRLYGIVTSCDVSPPEHQYRAQAMTRFDFEEFRKQLGTMKKMGSMRDLMSKIP
jgi:signal recognition particle GTPase